MIAAENGRDTFPNVIPMCENKQQYILCMYIYILYMFVIFIEEGFIQKRKQRLSLLLGGTELTQFLAALSVFAPGKFEEKDE